VAVFPVSFVLRRMGSRGKKPESPMFETYYKKNKLLGLKVELADFILRSDVSGMII
jgi:hypothetical protein